jgi:hypothetical protein
MEIERPEGDGAKRRDALVAGKKPYGPPRLIEWGSMIDLTRGFASDLDDLPMDGGTLVE